MKRMMIVLAIAGCGGGIGNGQARLRTAINAKQDSLDDCYGEGLERSAEAQGTMQLLVHVLDGRVGVDVTSSELEDPKLEKCVKAVLEKVKLNPAPDANFEVEYTVRFKPESG
jgi:hypothetical protein